MQTVIWSNQLKKEVRTMKKSKADYTNQAVKLVSKQQNKKLKPLYIWWD